MSNSALLRLAVLACFIGSFVLPLAARSAGSRSGTERIQETDVPEFTARGGERLAWRYPGDDSEALAGLKFRLYIDGDPRPLPDAVCQPSGEDLDCQAVLPALSSGVYTLTVAAVGAGLLAIEGPAAAPIRVRYEGADGGPGDAEGTAFETTTLAPGLEDPTDLAPLPGGSVLVAERSGRIRLYRDRILRELPLLQLTDVVTGDGRGLLALTADRDFEATQAVYALYSTSEGLRLARYRMAGDRLVDRAIVLEGLPAAETAPRAALRMGPDRRLYVALDDGGMPERALDRGSWAGKVLRVNADGTTPDDQPRGTPVLLAGLSRPAGLAWTADPRFLWVADRGLDGAPILHQAQDGTSTLDGDHRRIALPPEASVTALASEETAVPPRPVQALLLGSDPGPRGLLRVPVAEAGEPGAPAWAPAGDGADVIRALAIGPDGVVYACSAHALLRLDVRDR